MRFDVVTLFPELLLGYVGQSLLAKAIETDRVTVFLHNLRDWSKGRHRQVDDRPFGGGPGMVLKPEPVVECVEAVQELGATPGRVVVLTPAGKRLDQKRVEALAGENRLVLLCGRYEGFDQRIIDILQPDELSIGDYVTNGGEVAAMVVIDAVIRLVPGVLGDEASAQQDSFSGKLRRLEFAQYTRPRIYRDHIVPEVLISGDHQAVAQWREEDSKRRTAKRRPSDAVDETNTNS